MERWAFGAGATLGPGLVRDVLQELGLLHGRKSEKAVDLVFRTVKRGLEMLPQMVQTLRQAAAKGRLYHEVPLRYFDSHGTRVEGAIDLVYQDEDGWHILDYKAGAVAPTVDKPLESPKLRQHYAQVRCYADGFEKVVGDAPASYGIWYMAHGLLLRWTSR